MCGRFTLTADPADLQEAFYWVNFGGAQVAPRYNIAPGQPIALVTNNSGNRLDFFTWGLVPPWVKDPSTGRVPINARAETLAEKPSFRNAFKRRRCLILADGFYEWQQTPGAKTKTPLYFRLEDGRPFAFAGLWEVWNSADGSQIFSAAIITTRPNALVAPIHERMPAILTPETYGAWLTPEEAAPPQLSPLLRPFPADQMQVHAVSPMVNRPQYDQPECIRPVSGG